MSSEESLASITDIPPGDKENLYSITRKSMFARHKNFSNWISAEFNSIQDNFESNRRESKKETNDRAFLFAGVQWVGIIL